MVIQSCGWGATSSSLLVFRWPIAKSRGTSLNSYFRPSSGTTRWKIKSLHSHDWPRGSSTYENAEGRLYWREDDALLSAKFFFFVFFPCPFPTERGVNTCTARGQRNVEHHTLYRYTRDPRSTTKSQIRFTKTKRATETANRYTLTINRTQAEAAIYWTNTWFRRGLVSSYGVQVAAPERRSDRDRQYAESSKNSPTIFAFLIKITAKSTRMWVNECDTCLRIL